MELVEKEFIQLVEDYNQNQNADLARTNETKIFYDLLLDKKIISLTKNGEIKKNNQKKLHVGRLQKKTNFGFVIMPESTDFHVKNVDQVLDGSLVLITEKPSSGKSDSAEIIGTLIAVHEYLVVTMTSNQVLKPLKSKYQDHEIKVLDLDYEQIRPGTVLSLNIETVEGNKLNCTLNNVISDQNDPDLQMKIILDKYQIDVEFPSTVTKELELIEEEISPKEITNRVDLRKQLFFTIDGDDSKDLDDAVSLIVEPNGYRIFVSIADVSHYVTPKTALDNEALSRATSVYFVDRVVPMLPKKISNGICSLHAGVDRLTMTCEMLLNAKGKVIEYKIYNSVINSDYRLTYTEVNKILMEHDKELISKYASVYSTLMEMNKISRRLKKNRLKRGSFNLEDNEAKFKVDDSGNIIDIYPVVRGDGEKLIEELMILANETVTKKVGEQKLDFLYRVHGTPNPNKLNDLKKMMAYLKISVDFDPEDLQPSDFKVILDQVEDPIFKRILSKTIVRSLQKAIYSVDNIGHFGLASTSYTHFSSPIRRYPDLQVHRLLKEYILTNYQIGKTKAVREDELIAIAKQASEKEIKAIKAEQEIEDVKKSEYMQGFISQKITGTISGLEEYGFFIELENTIRGLIRFSELKDFQKVENFEILFTTGEKLKYGQKLEVIVSGVNLERGLVDFLPVGFEVLTLQEQKAKVKKEKRSYFKGQEKNRNKNRVKKQGQGKKNWKYQEKKDKKRVEDKKARDKYFKNKRNKNKKGNK